jgi:hypothetical protein
MCERIGVEVVESNYFFDFISKRQKSYSKTCFIFHNTNYITASLFIDAKSHLGFFITYR